MAGLFSEEIHTIKKKSQIFECGMSERKAVGKGEKPCGLQLETLAVVGLPKPSGAHIKPPCVPDDTGLQSCFGLILPFHDPMTLE